MIASALGTTFIVVGVVLGAFVLLIVLVVLVCGPSRRQEAVAEVEHVDRADGQ